MFGPGLLVLSLLRHTEKAAECHHVIIECTYSADGSHCTLLKYLGIIKINSAGTKVIIPL